MRTVMRWKVGLLLAGLLMVGLAGQVGAGDNKQATGAPGGVPGGAPAAMTAGDQQVFDALREVINRGVDVFNPPSMGGLGDHNGCYRLFQGALVMAKAQLGNHPDLQKEIDAGLKDAERRFTAGERAHALRAVIDNVRAKVNPNPKKPEEKKPTDTKPPEKKPTDTKPPEKKPTDTKPAATLWERLGGEKGVRKVVDDFVAAAAKDPKVDFDRGGKYKIDVAHLKQMLVEQISSVSGGPLKYSGRGMKEVHKGMGITDAQYDATAAHLRKALEMNGAKAEDVSAVMKVVESLRGDIVEKKPPEPKPVDKKETTAPKPDTTPAKDKAEPKPPVKDKTEPKPPAKDSQNTKPDK